MLKHVLIFLYKTQSLVNNITIKIEGKIFMHDVMRIKEFDTG